MASTYRSLNVSVTPQLEAYVHGKVESGDYQSVSEVIREALRLLQERERSRAAAIKQMQAKIESGWAQARRGELLDGEQVFTQLLDQLDAMPEANLKSPRQPRKAKPR